MQLPGPVRAVVGLLAVAADEAKQLPDRAIELPMLAVSSALQMSLRAQQRYARLAARGDDVINRRPPSDEPPGWATFDDPVSADDLRSVGLSDPDPVTRARAASQLLDELLGGAGSSTDGVAPEARTAPARKPPAAKKAPPRPAPAKKAPVAKKAPAKKSPVKSASSPLNPASSPAKPASTAKNAPAKKVTAAKKATSGKTINRPRHTTPSRFDTVHDD
jgi:hypothetical protein